ncbi:MAG: hypothetical protein ACJA0T_000050 [Colwellia sp.]|jgi:hypothetical protein
MLPNIHKISQDIKNKNFNDAEKAIISFIEHLVYVSEEIEVNPPKNNSPFEFVTVNRDEQLYSFLNKVAVLLTELFSAKNYYPSDIMIATFLTQKYVIDNIFIASFWNNTDSLIDHLGIMKINKSGQTNLTEKNLTLLLMLVTISSKYKLPWGSIFKSMPARGLSAYVGLITQHVPALSEENNKGYNHLLASAKDLPIFELPVLKDLGKLAYSFYICSYATSPEKYEFKKWMTKTLRANLTQWLSPKVKQYIDGMPGFQQKPKLKMAVMLEQYSPYHAMTRCFNILIINLSKQYELIAFTDKLQAEHIDRSIFKKVIVFQDLFDVSGNAELITQEIPDLIFYPSIGMTFWGIYLSQLRLAPIQLMTGGHPSSSFSPEIDYFLIVGESFTAEDLQPYISEKVILLDNVENNYTPHTLHLELDDEFIKEHNQFIEYDEKIRVAVNGVMTKVTYDIIQVCKKIELESKNKVTFVFFSSSKSNSLAYLSAKKQLSRSLKSIEVISFSNYKDYMTVISQCHLLLPTLPFGGSNSNVDAMVLNKPKLFLKGDTHLYTRTDQCEWERVDLVNELGCKSITEMVEKAVDLINDKTKRKALHQTIVDKKCFERTFIESKANEGTLGLLINKAIEEYLSTTKVNYI